MCEYELYVPLFYNDGQPIDEANIDELKNQLAEKFGGVTHFPQENEGLWRVGSHTFRDKIEILRVLADDCEKPLEYFTRLKQDLKTAWHQDEILIVQREVKIL